MLQRSFLTGILSTAVLLPSCHTVWTHPDASEQKYNRDLYYCQYGAEPPAEGDQDAVRKQAILSVRRGWKQCMVKLGWDKTTGFGASYKRVESDK